MKIAVLSCFYPFRGGISQFNACLFGELGREHDVRAFNFSRQYPGLLFPGKTQYVSEDDNAVRIESESLLDSINPFSWGRTFRAIAAWGPDLVITRYWMSFFAPSLGYVTRRLRRKCGCRVVSILDNVVPHEPHFFDAPLTKYFLKGSDAHVVMCGAVAQDLLRLKPEAQFIELQHPLYSHFGEKLSREEAERRLGLEPGKRNLLFFGLIREYKGLDILLEAFAGLGDEYQLIVAGEPYGSFEKYQKIIDEKILAGRVHLFLHYIKDSEVSEYFSAADLCVLPYRSATQSGISSVSYHFGVPMVVTDVGGLEETIGQRGTGIVARECTPDCIRTEIERYFADPAIGASCRQKIESEKERLSWKNFCASLLDFSENVQKK
ncbi:MAG: glycosyltransferase [Bacteroidales bacterium]|nr:glycosyltransferase [Bacteroidales bacterium]